jgi:STE24 endopeptidase
LFFSPVFGILNGSWSSFMNVYLILIIFFLVSKYILDLVTEVLNNRHLKTDLPEEFSAIYNADKYSRSQRYTRDHSHLALLQNTVSILLLLPFILLKGFNLLDLVVRDWGWGSIATGLAYTMIIVLIAFVFNLPFRVYRTFTLEERYGFNKTTAKTFILDTIKSIILMCVIGLPLLALILWFFETAGDLAPLYIWILLVLFQFFMTFISPLVILPLFNTFTPLPPGELRTAIENYAHSQNFKIKGIFTMDGSKRSAKANAFFTGFGKSKRIVLFDTLIANHTVDELVSILAHEVGHYKLKHIFKGMAVSFLENGLMLFFLSIFLNNSHLFAAFGMENLSVYASLIFFGFLYSPVSLFLNLLGQKMSRAHEIAADRFVIQSSGLKEPFISSLKKLSVHNLANLTPHPLKVALHYSHPPVLERIRMIRDFNPS